MTLVPPQAPTPSFGSRIVAWFRALLWGTTACPPPPERYVPATPGAVSGEPFSSPAKGDAYDFTVAVRWEWVGGAWQRTDLAGQVAPYLPEVWDQILITTRHVLRQFPPDRPDEAEAELNARLVALAGSSSPASAAAYWTARAEVSLHEEVRKLQRQQWTRQLVMAADHDLTARRIDDYDRLITKWRGLLATVQIGRLDSEDPAPFIGEFLVQLAAHPEQATEIIHALSTRRDEKDQELLATLNAAVHGSGQVNLLDYEMAVDSALRRLMEWAGLPVPSLTVPMDGVMNGPVDGPVKGPVSGQMNGVSLAEG